MRDRLDILVGNLPVAIVCGLLLLIWMAFAKGCG
jgi:hypothetical protein